MAGGVTLQVRQIGSYAAAAAGPGDLLLMQPGGLGNPYASVDAATLVATALENGGALGVGVGAPPGAYGGQIFSGHNVLPLGGDIGWNAYLDAAGNAVGLGGGAAAVHTFDTQGWFWASGSTPGAGQPVTLLNFMTLSPQGALALPYGTLTVARDPGGAMEVATAGWVGNNTVNSFNGRRGAVTLNGCDIYSALCLDSTIATENWVNANIQASIQMLLANHPFVFGWNGRTGAVYLTLADISCVFFQPGQQPITQTPPLTSNDYSIPNTAWVVEYIANEFAGGGTTLATQAWVLANTVNSFNGRMGPVTLTSSDVFDVGAAPLNSPAFSGIPTAPTAAVGQATGQIATTAFVQMAITNNTAGVSTFNTRSGDVTLEAADVVAVGGLTNPSPALLGNPTAPTQPPGTNLPVIATCEFVQAAIAAGTVTSFNTRTGAVTLTLADVTGVGGAPLVSPAFSSVPTAPTAAPGTNTVQLATCAFVTGALATAGGVSSFNGRTGVVDLIANDISAAGGLVNPSVGLTGSPTATTATAGDNSTRIATTAFVQTALSAGAVSSFNTRTGAVTLQGADITGAGGALLASPAFTGAPTAPTAAPATNNTQIATTAYVTAAILADTTGVTSFNTRTGAITLVIADITAAGGAPIASPSFTGTPLGPTATPGTSTTQLATTAFVQNAIASSGVSSFNARTGAVTLIANDISAAGGALLAGPTFTGIPAAPTAAPGTNTGQLATTAFVQAAMGSFLPLSGGVLSGPLTGTSATFSGIVTANGNFVTNNVVLTGGSGSTWTAALGPFGSGAPTQLTTFQIFAAQTNLTGALNVATDLTAATASNLGGVNFQGSGNVITSGTITVNSPGTVTAPTGNFVTLGSATQANLTSVAISNNLTLNCPGIHYAGIGDTGAIAFSYGSPNLFVFQNGATVGSVGLTSDASVKSSISPSTVDCLATLLQVVLNQFTWTGSGKEIECGLIAQNLEPVIPDAIIECPVPPGSTQAPLLSLDFNPLVAYCIGAIQQLSARLAALEGGAA